MAEKFRGIFDSLYSYDGDEIMPTMFTQESAPTEVREL